MLKLVDIGGFAFWRLRTVSLFDRDSFKSVYVDWKTRGTQSVLVPERLLVSRRGLLLVYAISESGPGGCVGLVLGPESHQFQEAGLELGVVSVELLVDGKKSAGGFPKQVCEFGCRRVAVFFLAVAWPRCAGVCDGRVDVHGRRFLGYDVCECDVGATVSQFATHENSQALHRAPMHDAPDAHDGVCFAIFFVCVGIVLPHLAHVDAVQLLVVLHCIPGIFVHLSYRFCVQLFRPYVVFRLPQASGHPQESHRVDWLVGIRFLACHARRLQRWERVFREQQLDRQTVCSIDPVRRWHDAHVVFGEQCAPQGFRQLDDARNVPRGVHRRHFGSSSPGHTGKAGVCEWVRLGNGVAVVTLSRVALVSSLLLFSSSGTFIAAEFVEIASRSSRMLRLSMDRLSRVNVLSAGDTSILPRVDSSNEISAFCMVSAMRGWFFLLLSRLVPSLASSACPITMQPCFSVLKA
eukprot:6950320-Prymnesium_polylepis.3